jgi:hypothetical protein
VKKLAHGDAAFLPKIVIPTEKETQISKISVGGILGNWCLSHSHFFINAPRHKNWRLTKTNVLRLEVPAKKLVLSN